MGAEKKDLLLDSVLIAEQNSKSYDRHYDPYRYTRYPNDINGGRKSAGCITANALGYKRGESQKRIYLPDIFSELRKINENICCFRAWADLSLPMAIFHANR